MGVSNNDRTAEYPYLGTELPYRGLTVIMSVFGVICLLMIPILLLKIFYKPPKKKPLQDVEHYASDDSLSDFPKPLFDDDDDDFYHHNPQEQHKTENEVANEGGAQKNKPAEEASQQNKPVAEEASHKTLNSHGNLDHGKHDAGKGTLLDHSKHDTLDHAKHDTGKSKTTLDHAKPEH